MNDFTKEELQYLLEMVDSIKIVNRLVSDDMLQEKIQSMIDNYCEHSHKSYSIGDTRPLVMTHDCVKCGKVYYDE